MAGKGGRTPGAGRKKGVPNKLTADIKALAGQHSAKAIAELARLATGAQSEQARVSAIKELLDRAHGKPAQAVELTGKDGGAIKVSNDGFAAFAAGLDAIALAKASGALETQGMAGDGAPKADRPQ